MFKASGKWHTVYYNPPSGSWKSLFLVKGEYEYRQVGPKRGVGKIKRPDLAVQILEGSGEPPVLLLIEAKPSRDEWDSEIVKLLRAYFDGVGSSKTSKPVKSIPFSHRRKMGTTEWEELKEDKVEREWFGKCRISYLYGFAYSIGLVKRDADLSDEVSWMSKIMRKLGDSPPPLFTVALGWHETSYKPIVVIQFSKTFPESMRTQLESIFKPYIAEVKTKSTTLNHFV